jgi:large subunit ribosomal protein L7/L12
MHTHSNMKFNMNANKFLYSSQKRFNSFQSTRTLLEESKEDKAPAAAAPEADEVPEFQNPLHHNDPNSEKIMIDEYPEGEAPIVPLPPFDDGSGNVVAPPHLHALADEIVGLTMLEVKELVDRVADHFGIEEGEDDFSGGDGVDGAEAEVVEVKTTFDLKLTGFDAKSKIKVIKEVRAITGLGLKEAKELVEGAPKTVSKDIKMEEAEKLKAKLEAVGATVEIE